MCNDKKQLKLEGISDFISIISTMIGGFRPSKIVSQYDDVYLMIKIDTE